MAIAILKQEPTQRVPRPFARAANFYELGELLVGWLQRHAPGRPGPVVAFNCIDSDMPILQRGGVRFYAFREEAQQ